MSDIQIIVETPMGSTRKFDRDFRTGLFQLTKIMPKGMAFPHDFGYIPGTLGEDGDPLDVICLSETPTFSGCQISCRLLGAIQILQTERDGKQVRNDRYIAVPAISQEFDKVSSLGQLPNGLLDQLELFFVTYNQLAGKKLRVLGRIPSKAALKLVKQSIEAARIQTFRIELLVPVTSTTGKEYPESYHQELKRTLIEEFGGLTVCTRSPAMGYWKDGARTVSQTLRVYVVMANAFDEDFWKRTKSRLEQQFHQQEIMITQGMVSKV